MARLWSLSLFLALLFLFAFSSSLFADRFSFFFSLIRPLLPTAAETTHCYARIRTKDGDRQPACISVSGGIITRLYNRESEESEGASLRSQHKGYAYPGLWDGHGHVLGYGEMLHSVKLYGAESIEGITTPTVPTWQT